MVHRRTLKHSIRNFKDTLLDILGKRTVYHLPSLYFLSYNREYVMNFSHSLIKTLSKCLQFTQYAIKMLSSTYVKRWENTNSRQPVTVHGCSTGDWFPVLAGTKWLITVTVRAGTAIKGEEGHHPVGRSRFLNKNSYI